MELKANILYSSSGKSKVQVPEVFRCNDKNSFSLAQNKDKTLESPPRGPCVVSADMKTVLLDVDEGWPMRKRGSTLHRLELRC